MAETIRKSTFEKDFIERTYSSVVSDVTIAFSELVANSWDAGATTVNITLPSKANEKSKKWCFPATETGKYG